MRAVLRMQTEDATAGSGFPLRSVSPSLTLDTCAPSYNLPWEMGLNDAKGIVGGIWTLGNCRNLFGLDFDLAMAVFGFIIHPSYRP